MLQPDGLILLAEDVDNFFLFGNAGDGLVNDLELFERRRSRMKLEVINQPVASIAKQEEIIYVLGQEDQPIRLEHHSPILHLIQQIRDETHRFAVGFHRQRRAKRTLQTGLENIPGIGPRTAQKLLRNFGSVAQLRSASIEQIAKVVPRGIAERVSSHLSSANGTVLPRP